MKKEFLVLTTICCFAMFSAKGLDETQFNDLKTKLQDANPAVRISAIDQLVQGMARQFEEHPQGTVGNEVLPLLCAALSDTDAKVRDDAAAGLAMIAISTMPKVYPAKPGNPELKSYVPLRSILEHTMDDPNEHTRTNALVTYQLTFPVPGDLQDKLVDRFNAEKKNTLFRHMIMSALTIDGAPTAEATALLERLVNSPETTWQVAQVLPMSLNPPDSLLLGFVKQIPIAKESSIRFELFQAISKYGKRAKPYLDQLEKAKEAEADRSTKHNMQVAIDAIRDAQ